MAARFLSGAGALAEEFDHIRRIGVLDALKQRLLDVGYQLASELREDVRPTLMCASGSSTLKRTLPPVSFPC